MRLLAALTMSFCLFSRTLAVVGFAAAVCAVVPIRVAVAQVPEKVVKHQVKCPTCRIELTTVATIGGNGGKPVGLSGFAEVVHDSKGRFYAFTDESAIAVYDAQGRFLRTIGRRGQGPGEFAGQGGLALLVPPTIRIGKGDTIHVFDQPKLSVFAPDFRFVKSVKLPFIGNLQQITTLKDGTWLISGMVRTKAQAGYLTHILDSEGMIRKSIGEELVIQPGTIPGFPQYTLSPDERSLWFDGAYTFHEWSLDGPHGRHLRTLSVTDVTYPVPGAARASGAAAPRQTLPGRRGMIAGVDRNGRIWVSSPYPRPAGAPRRNVVTEGPSPSAPSAVEIIDPSTGDVLVSQYFERGFMLDADGTIAYSLRYDPDGFPIIDVMTFRVVGM